MGAGGTSMDIEDLQCITHSPVLSIYYKTRHGWGRRKQFNMKALKWLKNGILKIAFASAVFRKSAVLLIFEVEFTESALNILLYPESTQGSSMAGPEKHFFKMRMLILLQNAILRLAFANTVFHQRSILLIFEAEFTESVV